MTCQYQTYLKYSGWNVQVENIDERQESKNVNNNGSIHMYESIIFTKWVELEVSENKMEKTRKKNQQ